MKKLQELRGELAKGILKQADLARMLEISPTTLSAWLNEVHPAPGDLWGRIEDVLGLPAGQLGRDRQ